MKKAFAENPDYREGYVANVACIIMDNIPGFKDAEKRNEIADKIIHILFE